MLELASKPSSSSWSLQLLETQISPIAVRRNSHKCAPTCVAAGSATVHATAYNVCHVGSVNRRRVRDCAEGGELVEETGGRPAAPDLGHVPTTECTCPATSDQVPVPGCQRAANVAQSIIDGRQEGKGQARARARGAFETVVRKRSSSTCIAQQRWPSAPANAPKECRCSEPNVQLFVAPQNPGHVQPGKAACHSECPFQRVRADRAVCP